MSQQLKEILLKHSHSIDLRKERGIVSNLFVGIGLFHAIYNEDSYVQIPLPIIYPSTYIGYQGYKYYPKIKNEINDIIKGIEK